MTRGRALTAAADAITVVVGIGVLFVIGARYIAPSLPVPWRATTERVPEAAEEMKLDGAALGIDFSSGRTLIFAAQSDCSYCRESIPFYRRLLAGVNAVQFVVAAPPHDVGIRSYLSAQGLGDVDVVSRRQSTFRLTSSRPCFGLTAPVRLPTGGWGCSNHNKRLKC